MKHFISKIDFMKVFTTYLVARLILAAVLASPRFVGSVVVTYAFLVLAIKIRERIGKQSI